MAKPRREQTELLESQTVSQQPTGFPNQTDSEILYNPATRQITIQPKAPATSFDYYIKGRKHTISTPQQLTHPDTTALYYFYWDKDNALQFGTTEWNILEDVPISFVFYSTDYDGGGGDDGYHSEERHHSWRNPAAHLEFHEEVGTYIVAGFGISGYALQPGTPTDADNTFALATGTIADEDIRLPLPALSDGGPYTVFRRIGSGGPWQWNKTLTLPFYVGTTYIQWNEDVAGTWQLTEGITNNYYNYYVLKTTSIDGLFQTIIIPGQAQYSTLLGATSENLAELDLGTLPFVEIAPLYKITYRTSAAYTSTGKCRIEQVQRLVGTRISITAAAQTAHNSLSGLDFDTAGHGVGKIGFQRGTTHFAAPPTVNDDASQGFRAGDLGIDTNTQLFYGCVDPTVGAAVWHLLGNTVSGIWNRAGTIISPTNAGDTTQFDATGGIQFSGGGQNIVEFSTDGTLSGDSDTAIPTEKAVKTYCDTAPVGHLSLQKAYIVNPAGNDSNSGRSDDDALATLAAAITKVNTNGETRDAANRQMIRVKGAMDFTSNFTIPTYTTIEAFDSVIDCAVFGNNGSHLIINAAYGSATVTMFNKNTGSEDFTVDILTECRPQDDLVQNTSTGTIYIRGTRATILNTNAVIDTGSTGNIVLEFPGGIISESVAGTTPLFNFNQNNVEHKIYAPIIDNFSGGGTTIIGSGSANVKFISPIFKAASRALFSISGSIINIDVEAMEYYDGGSSTENNRVRKLILHDNNNNVVIKNHDNEIYFNALRWEYKSYSFSNLTTTPQTLDAFVVPSIYKIAITAPGGYNCVFELATALNVGTAFTHDSGIFSNATIAETPSPGIFEIVVGGYAAITYVLTLTTATNAATFKTKSGTATGTTKLVVFKTQLT